MGERIVLEDFNHFGGKHCWTTSLRNAFAYHDLELSEEMVFGLGGGLGFIYWYQKQMPAPLVGGRYGKKYDPLENSCKRIGGNATLAYTTSAKKGYNQLKELLREGEPAVTFVDMYYLRYMVLPEEAHFGAHTILVYGLDEDEDRVYVSDRSVKPLSMTIEDLMKARNSKYKPWPPMNMLVKIEYPTEVADLSNGIRDSIRESTGMMLHPPIKNIGLAGMQKWASLVTKWPRDFKGLALFNCLFNVFIYIEIGGTGGSSFRPMYAQFLDEASEILDEAELREIADIFRESGKIWSKIARIALPDSWDSLRRIRELSMEKSRIFEEQGPNGYERMKEIAAEVDDHLIKELVTKEFQELDERKIAPILENMKEKILELYEIEKHAFKRLNAVIS
ncbi:MAG: BtrH N-terminal domain-containing protein [Thermoplasmata archaeon]